MLSTVFAPSGGLFKGHFYPCISVGKCLPEAKIKNLLYEDAFQPQNPLPYIGTIQAKTFPAYFKPIKVTNIEY
jgi:hypothetical protein